MDLKAFLKKDGYSDELIANLMAETPLEDFKPSEALTGLAKVRLEVFRSGKEGKAIIEQAVKESQIGYKNAEKARINKLLGMGLSRRETDEMEVEDVLKQAKEFYKDSIEKLSTNVDENLKAELSTWKAKAQENKEALDALKESTVSEIQAAKEAAQAEVNEFHVDRVFTSIRDKQKWASDSIKEPGHFYIVSKIKERYNVDKDGKLTNKDGTQAVNFEENGIYENVGQAYAYLFQKQKFEKASAGGGTGNPIVDGQIITDNLTPNARRIIEAAKKQKHVM